MAPGLRVTHLHPGCQRCVPPPRLAGRASLDPADETTQQKMWACRNQAKANPCLHPECPSTQARPGEGCGDPVMAPGQALAQRLQGTLARLRAGVGQLPALLQQAARRARRGVAEVHSALGTVVAQGREVVAQAWEALVVFLLQHAVVPWLMDAAEAAGTAAPCTTPTHPET